ncbi:NAD-binding protein [Mycena maculata]|uniref:NAD-binding protein n=1 Tax=Mycena maculata TaxID=230809 RepID=A0AAD7MZC3_9AGAR|nr:NAD-binding protein [Mycena maculata]
MPVAFVTGCSNGGIGAALCRAFLAKGYVVYAAARSVDAMSELTHDNVRKLAVDVTDDESVAKGIEQVYKETDGIDVLVSNAGYSHIGPLLDTPFEEGLKMAETNFFGFVRLVKNVVPRMGQRNKGTVVAIGSILGELATPFQGFYNASKAALHMYTETLRMECEPIGVKVVLVASGSTKSNILANPQAKIFRNLRTLSPRARFIRRWKSRSSTSFMDTDQFASTVICKITTPKPPQYITVGGMVTTWWILKWLSCTTAESILWWAAQKEPKPGTYGPM